MKKILLAARDDGFTAYWEQIPPFTEKKLHSELVDHLKGKVDIREIGTGVGDGYYFDTLHGDLLGTHPYMFWIPEKIRDIIKKDPGNAENVKKAYDLYSNDGAFSPLRLEDFYAIANLYYLLSIGVCPFESMARRAHEQGMKVWARTELRRGAPTVLLQKQPFFIPGTNSLDYKHQLVRDTRTEIFYELVKKGADGISLDFCVYPPFFENPEEDGHYMTQFFKELREKFKNEDRKIDIIARLPSNPESYGLYWRDWIKEGVVDVIIPSVILPGERFDVPLYEYVKAAKGTGCKIFGCLRPKFLSLDPDAAPGDTEPKFIRPSTRENDYARAALLIFDGADGIQLGMGSAKPYNPENPEGENRSNDAWKPSYDNLQSFDNIKFKNKTYPLVSAEHMSVYLDKDNKTAVVPFRIADNVKEAEKEGYRVKINFCPIMRNLEEDESFTATFNNDEYFVNKENLSGDINMPISFNHNECVRIDAKILRRYWWEKGRKVYEISPYSLNTGENTVKLSIENTNTKQLEIVDIDIEVIYEKVGEC